MGLSPDDKQATVHCIAAQAQHTHIANSRQDSSEIRYKVDTPDKRQGLSLLAENVLFTAEEIRLQVATSCKVPCKTLHYAIGALRKAGLCSSDQLLKDLVQLNHGFTALHHFDDAKLAKLALDVSGFIGDSGQHTVKSNSSSCSPNASIYASSNHCIIANTTSDLSSIEEPNDPDDDLSVAGLDVWMSDAALQLSAEIVLVDAPSMIKAFIRQGPCEELAPSTDDGASSPPSVLIGKDPIQATFLFNEDAPTQEANQTSMEANGVGPPWPRSLPRGWGGPLHGSHSKYQQGGIFPPLCRSLPRHGEGPPNDGPNPGANIHVWQPRLLYRCQSHLGE